MTTRQKQLTIKLLKQDRILARWHRKYGALYPLVQPCSKCFPFYHSTSNPQYCQEHKAYRYVEPLE